ncbi:MAG: ABC transporter ATP-binding protein [Winogradskyella sp.]
MKNYSIFIKNLNFSYNKHERQFSNFSLKIPDGSIYGFVGPNGAGKSTLIRIISGLSHPSSGQVEILDRTYKKERPYILSKSGYLIESPSLYLHLSAEQNLKIAQRYKGVPNPNEIETVLNTIDLEHTKSKKVSNFSLGMKQRLSIGMALINKPKLLVLDEPTNGLDPQGIRKIRSLIHKINKDWGTTIFISSHLLSEIEDTCSHIAIINKGRLLFNGKIDEMYKSRKGPLTVFIESNNSKLLKDKINLENISLIESNKTTVSLSIQSKEQIPKIINYCAENDIKIYQVKIKNNLEFQYLNLISNEKI